MIISVKFTDFFSLLIIFIIVFCSACDKEKDADTVMDIDGNKYKTVRLGNQTWFAENLKTTRFADGTDIPDIQDDYEFCWYTGSARCLYHNQEEMNDIYGRMYNWYAVTDTCRLCPDGWHIPSDDEWDTLVSFLGGVAIAGGKMKAVDTALWDSPNVGATNESGFSILPGGYRNENGRFGGRGAFGIFWASTDYDGTSGRERVTKAASSRAWSDFGSYNHAFYVRCLKDE